MKRYRPRAAFTTHESGFPNTWNPDYVDPVDGLPGYPSLPEGLNKAQRASFEVLEIGPPVEQATSAPGEKRTRKRKPKAQTVEVEAVAEVDTVHDA